MASNMSSANSAAGMSTPHAESVPAIEPDVPGDSSQARLANAAGGAGSMADGEAQKETSTSGTIVVKIGGSTLGSHDTTLHDLVKLQRQGVRAVVVHGGGKIISDWMAMQGVKPRFVRGLRVTDGPSIDIVGAVLTGLINKNLVASMVELGARSIGISGADDAMLRANLRDPELGLVGDIFDVNIDPINAVLDSGCIPVIAPVGVKPAENGESSPTLLNINADTAAGEISAALGASKLVFLTDVQGVLDNTRRLIPRLTERQARGLIRSNVAAGGMIPKIEACLTALSSGGVSHIIDGRKPDALIEVVSGATLGTRIG
ncbi:MAG: acetylglutamate kinase [Chloroflexi bacterium]|nr:acetylglutamate kinase [Chloroflexota bacterium]